MQQKQVYVVEHNSGDKPNMVFEDLETLGSTITKMFGTLTESTRRVLREHAEGIKEISRAGRTVTCIGPDGSSTVLVIFPATLNLKK